MLSDRTQLRKAGQSPGLSESEPQPQLGRTCNDLFSREEGMGKKLELLQGSGSRGVKARKRLRRICSYLR